MNDLELFISIGGAAVGSAILGYLVGSLPDSKSDRPGGPMYILNANADPALRDIDKEYERRVSDSGHPQVPNEKVGP